MKEFTYKGVIAFLSTGITAYLGGWDIALQTLTVLIIADYIFGVLSAIRRKNLNSDVMFWGGIRKAAIIAVVGLCVLFDHLVGNTEPIFRTLAIYFYIVREVVSLTENLGHLGVPLPPFVKNVLAQLNEKAGGNK